MGCRIYRAYFVPGELDPEGQLSRSNEREAFPTQIHVVTLTAFAGIGSSTKNAKNGPDSSAS